MARREIIVVGGSAGSTKVLSRMLEDLPRDFSASLFIVTHIPAGGSQLPEIWSHCSALSLSEAIDGQPIEKGHVYVGPADRHLLLRDGVICLGRGPRENMARPSIDPLFRSAALTYGSGVIGVILSGFLNDGAAGLAAIKERGGLAIVQHPLDAEVDEMPRAAIEAVDADRVFRAGELAGVLVTLASTTGAEAPPASSDLRLEVRIAADGAQGSTSLAQIALPSVLTCPSCHGVLSEVKGSAPLRYRCQTGHAFTAEAAFAAQERQVDEAVVVALRVMEERLNLVTRMAREARDHGRGAIAELYEVRAEEYGRYAATLREAATRGI